MGFEFIIKLNDNDLKSILENKQGPTSLEELLKSIPGYIPGTSYGYAINQEQANSGWIPNIMIENNNLIFCSYTTEDYQMVVQYLLSTLMDICGRFEIMDA